MNNAQHPEQPYEKSVRLKLLVPKGKQRETNGANTKPVTICHGLTQEE
jgi:hypothetical protein